MDGSSIIVLDSTGRSDLSSSVICLDSDNDHTSTPCHVGSERKKGIHFDLQGTGISPERVQSPIVIHDTSSEEEDHTIIVDFEAKEGDETLCPCPSSEESIKSKETDSLNKGQKRLSDRRRESSVSTPQEPSSKRQKIAENPPLASTPLPGSASSPKHPTVTPITTKYERMRAELSATKKEQKKLMTVQEELHEELKKFRSEFTSKKEEPSKASITVDVKSDDDSMLRPIVIDGSNVAMSHGNHKIFSCKGIALCIQYFQKRGHKNICALVPSHRQNQKCQIKDPQILDELQSKGLLSFTPSRRLRGKRVTPYDDRFILQHAITTGGVIISNDHYRDLMIESAEFKRVVENRLIMYVFAGDNFMVPEDPHGRYGPWLNDVLRRDSQWSKMVSPTVHRLGLLQNKTVPNDGNKFLNFVPPRNTCSLQAGPISGLRRSPRLHRMIPAAPPLQARDLYQGMKSEPASSSQRNNGVFHRNQPNNDGFFRSNQPIIRLAFQTRQQAIGQSFPQAYPRSIHQPNHQPIHQPYRPSISQIRRSPRLADLFNRWGRY